MREAAKLNSIKNLAKVKVLKKNHTLKIKGGIIIDLDVG